MSLNGFCMQNHDIFFIVRTLETFMTSVEVVTIFLSLNITLNSSIDTFPPNPFKYITWLYWQL